MKPVTFTNLESTAIHSASVTKGGCLDIVFRATSKCFYRYYFMSDKDIVGLLKAESRGRYLMQKIVGHKAWKKFEVRDV